MTLSRRSLLQAATAAAATVGTPALRAQGTWPTSTVRIVVGFPPGGGTDALARVISAKLSSAASLMMLTTAPVREPRRTPRMLSSVRQATTVTAQQSSSGTCLGCPSTAAAVCPKPRATAV